MTSEMEKKIKAVRAGRQLNVRQEMKKIEDIFEETCEKNHPDAEVLTIIQGIGTVPREQSGREIIYDKNSLTSYKFVKKGDFIIHLRSFEGGLEVANSDGIVSPAYIILHPKIEVSTIYLYALFHTNRFINQTMAPAVEGARDGRSVKYDVLKKQKIPFPPLSEQKKIAEILATQDRVIELKEKLIAEKQSQKKYLMSVLLGDDFKKPFKLKGVTIDKKKWEKKKLGEIATLKTGSLPQSINNIGPYYYVNAGCENSGYTDSFNCEGNVITTPSRGQGGIGEVFYQEKPFWLGPLSYKIMVLKDISVKYVFYAMLFYKRKIKDEMKTGSIPAVNAGDLEKIKYNLPSLPEQKAIADVLSAVDEEISLLQKGLEQEKLKKKSLMQLLLTGLVRVKV